MTRLPLPLLALPLAALLACGGDDPTTEECASPAPMDVTVTVLWPDGTTLVTDVPEGMITLDGEPCSNEGEGVYACVADPEGTWQLAIIDTRFNSYSEFLQLPVFQCGKNPEFKHTVQLGGMMGS